MVTCSGCINNTSSKEVIIDDTAYVYLLKNKDGLVYVGSTGEMVKRIGRHYKDLEQGKHHNLPLQELYNNGERFVLTYIRCESRESAFTFEQMLITKYEEENKLLNIGRHSRGGDNLTRHPNKDEIIERRTVSQQASYDAMTDNERKEKYGRPGELNGMYGKTHSEEACRIFSETHKGNQYRTGMKASDETREKISTIASERIGELNPFFGKQHTEETRKKLSEAMKGNLPANTNKVMIDGIVYKSQAEAARILGVATATITHRLKSKNPKYSGYSVI